MFCGEGDLFSNFFINLTNQITPIIEILAVFCKGMGDFFVYFFIFVYSAKFFIHILSVFTCFPV